jgi:hypothetical protein
MKSKAMLKEACDSAARQWVLAADPNREPEPYEEETYINGRWVMVSIQYNGEKMAPRRRAGDAPRVSDESKSYE